MKISELISPSAVLLQFEAENKKETLRKLAEKFREIHPSVNSKRLFSSLMQREELGSTGLGNGIAMPHAKSEEIPKPQGLLAVSKKGVDFHALDGEPVHVFFLMVYPQNPVGVHLIILAGLARLLRDDFVTGLIRRAVTPRQVIKIISEQEARITVLAGNKE
jgi:mannitol/fructose-specific phosphotransferase system IIA component (Ntr-type)